MTAIKDNSLVIGVTANHLLHALKPEFIEVFSCYELSEEILSKVDMIFFQIFKWCMKDFETYSPAVQECLFQMYRLEVEQTHKIENRHLKTVYSMIRSSKNVNETALEYIQDGISTQTMLLIALLEGDCNAFKCGLYDLLLEVAECFIGGEDVE